MCSVVTDVTVQSEIQIVGTEIDTGAFHQSQLAYEAIVMELIENLRFLSGVLNRTRMFPL